MFFFKLRHRLKNWTVPRKPKFASDQEEIRWLLDQGRNATCCCFANLTAEQQTRWYELTDRPFPEYRIVTR